MPKSAKANLDEFALIDRFFRPLAGEGAFGLTDDAALLAMPLIEAPGSGEDDTVGRTGHLVISTDMIAEGVHFLPDDSPETIARKALRVNISDLTAKGAKPIAYTLGLALKPDLRESWLEKFCAGLAEDQSRYGIRLIGGDTITLNLGVNNNAQHIDVDRENVSGAALISVTVFGSPAKEGMVLRSGGSPGDLLFASGVIGSAAAGLSRLTEPEGPFSDLPGDIAEEVEEAYRVPNPPYRIAGLVARYASAAMDISDGLIGDSDKLAAASGCSGVINADQIPIHQGLRDLVVADDVLIRLMSGGDDYQVLAAVPPQSALDFLAEAAAFGVDLTEIGHLTSGSDPLHVIRHGQPMPVKDRSYKHASPDR